MDPNYVLLSCTCDFTQSPPFFHAEIMPVETPDYLKDAQLSDNDLFFLRWVFEDHFDLLTTYIELNLPQYRIHVARPEHGVSWSAYRNKERGFLVWLVKSKEFQDPLSSLKSALLFYKAQEERKERDKLALSSMEDTKDVSADDMDDDKTIASTPISGADQELLDVPKLVAEQLQLVRNNIKKYYEEMEAIESLVNQIWTVDELAPQQAASDLKKKDVPVQDSVEDSLVATSSEWCVVDDAQFEDVSLLAKDQHKPKAGLLQKVSKMAL